MKEEGGESADKLFMPAYCCTALTLWLLTQFKLSLSALSHSLWSLFLQWIYSRLWLSTPSFSPYLRLPLLWPFSFVPPPPRAASVALSLSHRPTQRTTLKNQLLCLSFLSILSSFFLSPSLGLHLSPLPHTPLLDCGHSVHVCIWGGEV